MFEEKLLFFCLDTLQIDDWIQNSFKTNPHKKTWLLKTSRFFEIFGLPIPRDFFDGECVVITFLSIQAWLKFMLRLWNVRQFIFWNLLLCWFVSCLWYFNFTKFMPFTRHNHLDESCDMRLIKRTNLDCPYCEQRLFW